MTESKKYIDLVWGVLQNWWIKFAEFTPNLFIALLVFLLFIYGSKFLSRISVNLFQKLFPKSRNQETIITLIGFFRFLIILIATFIALEIMGLSSFFMKFLGSLGVAGIIAGVALKDIVSSMFSGMLVGIDKAFKQGDYVQLNGISGNVEDIGFLTTKLIADDGKKYYIPNQLIFSAPFINFTASGHRRVILELEIPNTQDLEQAKTVIRDEVKQMPYLDREDEIQVIFSKQNLGIFYLNVRFWLKKGENLLNAQSQSYIQIKKRLDEEGISMVNPAQNFLSNSGSS